MNSCKCSFSVCPECGNPGIEVPEETVVHFIQSVQEQGFIWSLCTNPGCKVSYYNDNMVFHLKDLQYPIWFKDDSPDCPICYCAGLTRGEIKDAVQQGITSIKAILEYTSRKMTCQCHVNNPLGKCCNEVLMYFINKNRKSE